MARAGEPQLAAKFKLAIVSFYAGMGKTRIQTYVDQIKAINPSIKLGTYVVMTEYRDNAVPTDTDYVLVDALNKNGWWTRDATTGNKVQWTAGYGTWATNPTAWTKTDATGRRWPEFKAQFDTDHIVGGIKGLDYIYIDQVNDNPWVVGDYMQNGTNQSKTDPVVSTEYRKGQAAYFNALRARNPGKMLIPNAASLASAEFNNQVEGAFMECVIGKSWSQETWAGWNAAMTRYRTELAQTKAPHDVVFQTCGATADPAVARYGLASSLMEDGYFAYTVSGQAAPPWFDEYDARIGTPAEAPPTAATASGIWMRRYTNGVVLVNPSKTTAATIDIGPGYKHVLGTKDPVVNNGMAERMITLQPRSGMIMVKE
jgi:hypothetical protein